MEVVTKKKRGRPRRFTSEWAEFQRSICCDVETERGNQDILYRQTCLAVLDDGDYGYIFNKEDMIVGKNTWRPTLMTELGRIDDDDEMRKIARRICEIKPKTTREAVYMVRRYRLGQSGEGNCLDLTIKIGNTVNEYWKRFPKTTIRQVVTALQNVMDEVEDLESAH
jgi:hypothetical protein